MRQLHDYIIPFLGDRVEMAHGIEGRPVFLDRFWHENSRSAERKERELVLPVVIQTGITCPVSSWLAGTTSWMSTHAI